MSNIKALEDLRVYANGWRNGFGGHPSDVETLADRIEHEVSELQESWAQEAREHAEDVWKLAEQAHENAELKREISERYMELPCDADGVPIHVGDCLQLGDTRGEVVALTYCPANGKLPWEWQCDTGDWYNTAFAYHVKPRTLEDVLEEFADMPERIDRIAATKRYANEIRELLGVGE